MKKNEMASKTAIREIKMDYQMIHFISSAILMSLIRDIKAMNAEAFIIISPTCWVNKESAIADIRQELEERSWEQ